MDKVSSIDFSKHELKVTQHEGIVIYEFTKPDTIVHGLTYINAKGVLAVTGDFGNWIFCREFHLSPNGHVDRNYWDEKLEILSEQKPYQFSSEETQGCIAEFVDEFPEYYDREMNDEEKEWIEKLYYNVDDEFDYKIVAYRENPNTIDYESVPYGEDRHFWLDVVYDAFNEMCEIINHMEGLILDQSGHENHLK